MLVVTDIDRSVEFYKKVFGLHIIMDFGANKTLTGGLALQTAETYKEFIGASDISFGGNNFELYFEEDDFDKFADKLKEYDIEYVHPIMEHSWGQRVVRFYDPDKHIIEVGENMKVVCKRFLDSGMTPEQAKQLPFDLYRDGYEYYLQSHAHPGSTFRYTKSSLIDLMAFDASEGMYLINQPLLMMAGSLADTFYMTEQCFSKATGTNDKELYLIPGARHIQTYWVPEYVDKAVNKLTDFFGKHL